MPKGSSGLRRAALLGVAGLTVAAAIGLTRVDLEADLLRSLPSDPKELALLEEVGAKFGVLRTVIIGVTGSELFTPGALKALKSICLKLRGIAGVAHVQSITTVVDAQTKAGGSSVSPLIGKIPSKPKALKALKDKVLSREGVAGALISPRGDAALVIVYLRPKAPMVSTAKEIRTVANAMRGPLKLTFGGAPAVAEFIGRVATARLTWVGPVAAILLLGLLAVFALRSGRGWAGLWLPILSGGLATAWTLGALALAGVRIPAPAAAGLVVPFALGLGAGWALAGRDRRALLGPVTVATLIAAAALAALLWRPELRLIGWIGVLGALFSWVASVALALQLAVPAAGAEPMALPRERSAPLIASMGVAVLVLGAAGALGLAKLDFEWTSVSSFSSEDEPHRADAILRKHFEMHDVAFVRVRANLRDHRVVRYLARLVDRIVEIPGVASAESMLIPLRIVHKTATGRRQLPGDSKRLKLLWQMLEANPDLQALVDPKRTEALLQVRLFAPTRDKVRAAINRLRQVVKGWAGLRVAEVRAPQAKNFREMLARDIAGRLKALAARYGLGQPAGLSERLQKKLRSFDGARARPVVEAALRSYVKSDEALFSLKAKDETAEKESERITALSKTLAPMVIGHAPAKAVAAELKKQIPEAILKEDPGAVAQAAPMLLEQLRSSVLRSAVRMVHEAIGPVFSGKSLEPRRRARLAAELKTILYSLLDDAVVVRARGAAAANAAKMEVAVTGPSMLLGAASRATRGSAERVGLLALGILALLSVAALRFVPALTSILPFLLATVAAFGVMSLLGIPFDPSAAGIFALCVGVGGFSGALAVGAARKGARTVLLCSIPLLAAAAAFAALLAARFAPAQRFGLMAALALFGAAIAAAWLGTVLRPPPENEGGS